MTGFRGQCRPRRVQVQCTCWQRMYVIIGTVLVHCVYDMFLCFQFLNACIGLYAYDQHENRTYEFEQSTNAYKTLC